MRPLYPAVCWGSGNILHHTTPFSSLALLGCQKRCYHEDLQSQTLGEKKKSYPPSFLGVLVGKQKNKTFLWKQAQTNWAETSIFQFLPFLWLWNWEEVSPALFREEDGCVVSHWCGSQARVPKACPLLIITQGACLSIYICFKMHTHRASQALPWSFWINLSLHLYF